jgi:membrane protease YdiL (CAAX protease family)
LLEGEVIGTIEDAALVGREDTGALTWRGPVLMLGARSGFAVVAQALAALIFALRSSATPWHDAEPWMPVYGTLIDVGCLTLLWQFTRREGIGLGDLIGFDRSRLARDLLLGVGLIPVGLALILGGVYATGWLVYGTGASPYLFEQLPLPAALYGVFVFPVVWGLTEQMTYNGYLVPRFRVLCRSTGLAVALVSIVWSFQHAVMPLTFDPKFMAVRALSPLPFSLFQTLLYLRLRRLIPFAIAHAVMDGASAFIGVLLPHLMP